MINWFLNLSPVYQALLAGIFTWSVTAVGASVVFYQKNINKKTLDWTLGFAAGVMLAASYWSLLAPAIEMSRNSGLPIWVPPAVGFVAGGITMRIIDKYIPHLHLFKKVEDAEGVKTSWHRSILLVSAITIHNIPEGLAIGVAFGAASLGLDTNTVMGAIALSIGIGIQNLPEGTAVSVPLRREGFSQWKSFFYGQLSGMVEPVFAVLGALLVIYTQSILPYALAFAAGAMIFVVVEELIPESQASGNGDLATMGVIFGFTIMMILDVALG